MIEHREVPWVSLVGSCVLLMCLYGHFTLTFLCFGWGY